MIIMSIPASLAIFAAFIFVAIPPVPRALPAPPAISVICSSISVTTGISFASGFLCGSLL